MADEQQGVIRAAGGLVWRLAEDGGEGKVEVAVIHRPRYDDWSIPKGKLSPGEAEIEGAVREVLEETGFRVRIGRPLGEVRYRKRVGERARPKVVRYWAMEAEGGSFSPTREVDDIRWVSLGQAQELLTHDHDREILQRFATGPAFIGSLLLVRHGSAGDREAWKGDDRARPLDQKGEAQADELIRLLSRYEVDEVVSADFVRCVQTVQPVADAVGLSVKEEPLFSELGYYGAEGEALLALRSYARPGTAVVISSQGDVIPDLITRLEAEDHVDLPDPIPCKKASVWALSFDGNRLFSAEYFPPPKV